jgi:hypothetical protein
MTLRLPSEVLEKTNTRGFRDFALTVYRSTVTSSSAASVGPGLFNACFTDMKEAEAFVQNVRERLDLSLPSIPGTSDMFILPPLFVRTSEQPQLVIVDDHMVLAFSSNGSIIPIINSCNANQELNRIVALYSIDNVSEFVGIDTIANILGVSTIEQQEQEDNQVAVATTCGQ